VAASQSRPPPSVAINEVANALLRAEVDLITFTEFT
jgi:hypothetical protein